MRHIPFILLTLCAVYAGCAERTAWLSARETAQIRVDVLRALMDQLAPERQDTLRLWISPYSAKDPETGRKIWIQPTQAEQQALEAAFPSAQVADTSETLYLCPSGGSVALPDYGCPIKDDGVVVVFDSLQIVSPDILRTAGMLIQSMDVEGNDPPRTRETITWAQGFDLLFVRQPDGRWLLRETSPPWITSGEPGDRGVEEPEEGLTESCLACWSTRS